MAREENALVLTGVKEMALRQEKPLEVPNENFVRVRVHSCGICGSDMHAYYGHDERRVPPLILGHEIVGWLEGSNDRVVINPLMTCGECYDCTRYCEHLCEVREMLGMRIPGGFAPSVVVKRDNIRLIPENLSFDEAVLTEPLACAVHAVSLAVRHNATAIQNATVTIIGGGAIGLLIGQVLIDFHVAEFTLIEAHPGRRKILAERLPEANVIAPDGAEDDQDYVFDAVGSGKTRELAVKIAAPGGVICHVGLQDNEPGIDTRRLTLQEIGFIGSYCYDGESFDYALKMLSEHRVRMGSWLDYRPLAKGSEAFKELAEGSDFLKIVLTMHDNP